MPIEIKKDQPGEFLTTPSGEMWGWVESRYGTVSVTGTRLPEGTIQNPRFSLYCHCLGRGTGHRYLRFLDRRAPFDAQDVVDLARGFARQVAEMRE